MHRLKEILMTNKEKLELITLTEHLYGPNNHVVLDMRSSVHRRLAELQRKAKNELDESEISFLEHHLTDFEYA